MPAKQYLVGRKFGRLEVISELPRTTSPKGKYLYKVVCRCDCGKEIVVTKGALTSNHTFSCGCYAKETAPLKCLKHGHARHVGSRPGTKTYHCWDAMIQRTTNPRVKNWKNYGGRGITVCERWLKFENFLADMGEKPAGLTLERTDNNKGYNPSNCQWKSRLEQNHNMRSNRNFTVHGVFGCMAELARHFGRPYGQVRWRLKHGWTIEQAFTIATGTWVLRKPAHS